MAIPKLFLKAVGFIERMLGPDQEESFEERHSTQFNKKEPKDPYGKYFDITDAVESSLENLLKNEIPDHIKLARNDKLELHRIDLEPQTDLSEELLDAFFREFVPVARQDWISDFVGHNAAVSLEFFAGIFRYSADDPTRINLDPFEVALNRGSPHIFKVTLWARWVRSKVKVPGRKSDPNFAPVLIKVSDRAGSGRDVSCNGYPIEIGKQGDVVADAEFTSAKHCTIKKDGDDIVLEDHSTNGTWIDGVRLHGVPRVLKPGRHRIKLGKSTTLAHEAAIIEIEILKEAKLATSSHTPILMVNPTPIAFVDASPVVIFIESFDANGMASHELSRLPFEIGRSSGMNYTTPPEHIGVSGRHLEVVSLNESGAHVINHAVMKNGTSLNGLDQGPSFNWPFGAEVLLAPKWNKSLPVQLVLRSKK